MWNDEQLERVRLAELQIVLPFFGDRRRVLEIGAGAGWQARYLAENGFDVSAIEYAHPAFEEKFDRVWPIEDYDGRRLPFADSTFDVVFSSNVLEHVPHVRELQQEIRRVLKPDGLAVHLIPTATWRFWTIAAHYPVVARQTITRLTQILHRSAAAVEHAAPGTPETVAAAPPALSSKIVAKLRELAAPQRHGEVGNVISEHLHFSRWKWRRVFTDAGFTIVKEGSSGIFYTGYGVLVGRLPLSARKKLSGVLGSSCRYWVLAPGPVDPAAAGQSDAADRER